jgi:hypothetical protein
MYKSNNDIKNASLKSRAVILCFPVSLFGLRAHYPPTAQRIVLLNGSDLVARPFHRKDSVIAAFLINFGKKPYLYSELNC